MNAPRTQLVFCIATSTEDPPRTAAALLQVIAACRAGGDVVLWLWHEGVRLAVSGVAETFREPLSPTPIEILDALAADDVPVFVHKPCFHRREFQEDALRTGCETIEGDGWLRLLSDGYTPVSL